ESAISNDPVVEARTATRLAEALLAVGRYGEAWLRLEEAQRKAPAAPLARGDVAQVRGRLLLSARLPQEALPLLLAAAPAPRPGVGPSPGGRPGRRDPRPGPCVGGFAAPFPPRPGRGDRAARARGRLDDLRSPPPRRLRPGVRAEPPLRRLAGRGVGGPPGR